MYSILFLNQQNMEVGYMEVTGFFSMIWADPRLQFTYSQPFHNVDEVRMNPDDVWTPTIELYGS